MDIAYRALHARATVAWFCVPSQWSWYQLNWYFERVRWYFERVCWYFERVCWYFEKVRWYFERVRWYFERVHWYFEKLCWYFERVCWYFDSLVLWTLVFWTLVFRTPSVPTSWKRGTRHVPRSERECWWGALLFLWGMWKLDDVVHFFWFTLGLIFMDREHVTVKLESWAGAGGGCQESRLAGSWLVCTFVSAGLQLSRKQTLKQTYPPTNLEGSTFIYLPYTYTFKAVHV